MTEATVRFTYENDAGEEVEVRLPAKWEVCPDCGGNGRTLNENLRGAFTAEEFEACFDDEESREQYARGGDGIYGVDCKTCKGRTTVAVVDEARCDKDLLARFHKHEEDNRRYAAEERYWRRLESYAAGERD